MGYIIKNADVLCDGFEFENKDITIKDEKLSDRTDEGDEIIDATGMYVLPGLVNIHTHGAMGYDSTCGSYEGINAMSVFWAKSGTTAFLPTTTTVTREQTLESMQILADVVEKGCDGANAVGINMEGPYLSEKRRGAHRPDWLQSPAELNFGEVQKAANGHIKLVTLAPETDGAIEFAKEYSHSVKISLGHSAASYEQCMEAFSAGCAHVTHLFNAMDPIHHRNRGLIAAAFDSGADVELIGDGLHVCPTVAMMAYKMFGPDKMILINDSINATGLPEGRYEFCGYEIFLKDGIAVQEDGTLCGGTATLWQCVKNMISWGVDIKEAVKMASYNPARAIGLDGSIGSIKTGKYADLIIASKDLEIKKVFIHGKQMEI